MRLAKKGYFSGDPVAVMDAPANIVVQLIHFEIFENELEKAYHDLNDTGL